ncbi:VOC family protein [Microlunatus ginsengisoli]|uniref:VOC family protein n=1 Tax=Microlunatus ginsengisoli TaxID=363863 RepID=A0ABP6ZZQ9_9ACTN
MKISRTLVVLDAPDLAAESGFWAAVFGGTVDAEDDWHTVMVDGAPRLAVQLAPGLEPPDWPHGIPQQLHLDVFVEDVKEASDEVLRLGARLLQEADLDAAEGYVVFADPAGHPFCLCW